MDTVCAPQVKVKRVKRCKNWCTDNGRFVCIHLLGMQFIPLRNSWGSVKTMQSHSLAHENNGRIILNTGSVWCVSLSSKASRCPHMLQKQETMGLVFAQMQQMFMDFHFKVDGTICVIVQEQLRFTARQAKCLSCLNSWLNKAYMLLTWAIYADLHLVCWHHRNIFHLNCSILAGWHIQSEMHQWPCLLPTGT